ISDPKALASSGRRRRTTTPIGSGGSALRWSTARIGFVARSVEPTDSSCNFGQAPAFACTEQRGRAGRSSAWLLRRTKRERVAGRRLHAPFRRGPCAGGLQALEEGEQSLGCSVAAW